MWLFVDTPKFIFFGFRSMPRYNIIFNDWMTTISDIIVRPLMRSVEEGWYSMIIIDCCVRQDFDAEGCFIAAFKEASVGFWPKNKVFNILSKLESYRTFCMQEGPQVHRNHRWNLSTVPLSLDELARPGFLEINGVLLIASFIGDEFSRERLMVKNINQGNIWTGMINL